MYIFFIAAVYLYHALTCFLNPNYVSSMSMLEPRPYPEWGSCKTGIALSYCSLDPHLIPSSTMYLDKFTLSQCLDNNWSNFEPRCTVSNYQRDGPMTIDGNHAGAPNYFPNSFSGPLDDKKFLESRQKVKLYSYWPLDGSMKINYYWLYNYKRDSTYF